MRVPPCDGISCPCLHWSQLPHLTPQTYHTPNVLATYFWLPQLPVAQAQPQGSRLPSALPSVSRVPATPPPMPSTLAAVPMPKVAMHAEAPNVCRIGPSPSGAVVVQSHSSCVRDLMYD